MYWWLSDGLRSKISGRRCKFEPIIIEVVIFPNETPMTIEQDNKLRDDLRAWLMSPAIGLTEYSADLTVQRRVGRTVARFAVRGHLGKYRTMPSKAAFRISESVELLKTDNQTFLGDFHE
jgi:hypothetical protein